MLIVQGKCLSCFQSEGAKKDGEKFTVNKVRIYNEQSSDGPLVVSLGDKTLEKGKFYSMLVWVSPFITKDGRAAYSLRLSKDSPIQEIPVK